MTAKYLKWKTGPIHNYDRAGQRPGRKGDPTPASVYTDRDARYAANLTRSPAQAQFGDPPPGFSALDERVGKKIP